MSSNDRDWPGRAWRGRVDLDQSILSQNVTRAELNIIRHARRSGGGGWSDPSPVSAGFVVTPCLRPTRLAEVRFEGRTVASSVAVPTGGLLIYALERSYSVHIPDPFDAVSFRVTQAALDEHASRLGHGPARPLSEPFLAATDDVMLNLSRALLPALARPAEVSSLFAEHVFDAVVLHLLRSAGGFLPLRARRRSRLSPHQLRMAQDMMLDEIGHDLTAAEIAGTCGLTIDQFNRGFRAATGLPPHRWRLRQRVLRAMELLDRSTLPISEIALSCGFADQSHLTRVFHQQVGLSPAVWRRQRRA